MNMLEYSKIILSKVSFDEALLQKEFEKAIRNITIEEQPALREWCGKQLGKKCDEIVLAAVK